MEAWGTHGVKLNFPEQKIIANTDPLREQGSFSYSNLPPSACIPEAPQPNLYQVEYYNTEYYLQPDLDPSYGQKYYDAQANKLYRKQ